MDSGAATTWGLGSSPRTWKGIARCGTASTPHERQLGSRTSVESWASMTAEHGWTFDDTEAWLNSMLRNQLFGDPLDAEPASIDGGDVLP